MAQSRKRKALTISDKVRIIKEVDENPKKKRCDMAKKLGLSVSTLCTIIGKRDEVMKSASRCGESASKILRFQNGRFAELEEALSKWFRRSHAANIPISGPILKARACELADEMNVDEFNATPGWLFRFQARHGIASRKRKKGASSAAEPDSVSLWKAVTLPTITNGYKPEDIFSADETGLYFNLLPERTLAHRHEKCHDGKKSKKRLTVLLACNATGTEKLKPLVVGKFENPHCFSKIRSLPTEFKHNKKAWMTSKLFTDWLYTLDAKMGSRGRKILLLLDRCSAHPANTSFLRNVKVEFLPANLASVLQPLDLGIIKKLKHLYRGKIVHKALQCLRISSLKEAKPNILQAMRYVAEAWHLISKTTIFNSFAKAGIYEAQIVEVEEEQELVVTKEAFSLLVGDDEAITFTDYALVDEGLTTNSATPVKELPAEVSKKSVDPPDEDESDEADDSLPPPPVVTFQQALAGLEAARDYLNSHGASDETRAKITELINITKRVHSNETSGRSLRNFSKATWQ